MNRSPVPKKPKKPSKNNSGKISNITATIARVKLAMALFYCAARINYSPTDFYSVKKALKIQKNNI